MKQYDNKEIARMTGITTTKVHNFVKEGLVIPADRQRGRSVIYTERNLIEIAMILVLQEQHHSLKTIKAVFTALRDYELLGYVSDFFSNDTWGRDKDIMAAVTWIDDRSKNIRTRRSDSTEWIKQEGHWRSCVDEVGIDYELTEKLVGELKRVAGSITMIKLGKIKNQAIESLKP